VLTRCQEWDLYVEGACCSIPQHIFCLEESLGPWAGEEQQGAPLGPLVWMPGMHSRVEQLCVGVAERWRFSRG